MSVKCGPKIVKDGLSLNLDVSNRRSFLGESTTNIISQDSSFENKSWTGWGFNAYTDGNKEFYTEDSYDGKTSVKLTNSTIAHIAFWWGAATSVVTGETYTVSIYVKNINCVSPFYILVSGSISGYFSTTYFNITNTWKRVSVTFNTLNTENLYFYIRCNNSATQGSFLIDCFQVEKKDYATPWVNGTRGNTVSSGGGILDLSNNHVDTDLINNIVYDRSNNSSLYFNGTDTYLNFNKDISFHITEPWSFSIDLKLHTDMISSWKNIIGRNADTYNTWMFHPSSFALYHNYYESRAWIWYTNLAVGTGTTLPVNRWTNITVTCTPVNSAQTFFVCYKNGIQTDSTTFTWCSDPITKYMVFNRVGGNGNRFFKGNISNIKIYNKALSSKEVLQNYNSKSKFIR